MATKKSKVPKGAKSTTFVVTPKNIMTDKAKSLSLNEIVFQLAPQFDNYKLIELLDKQGRKYTIKSLRWYASKARAGVRR